MRLSISLIALLAAAPAFADGAKEFPATLAGHAVLPAASFVTPPADAPAALQVSGKFTKQGSPLRLTAEPGTGTTPPFKGQPLQGFSGIRAMGDGTYVVITDNGFGAKANSPDAMLFFHVVKPDFAAGTVAVQKTTFLSDPNKVVPFNIVMEGTGTRYLTGADLDIEGFQIVGSDIVIGDEFGPYVIVADFATGVVKEFHETKMGEVTVKSPDHYSVQLPNPGGKLPDYLARRSRGYEGFAKSVDGKTLLGLLEGPLWDAAKGDWVRTADGREALPILEMDATTRAWTGRHWLYPVEGKEYAIGDFQMIDATRGLVIERDNGQGDAELACKDGQAEGCAKTPALFKRIYLVKFGEPGQPVEKVAYIDLLNMKDPNRIARQGRREDGTFRFPFVTIENVDRVDETHIIVANDNNFPFSKGRDLSKLDDNEVILLEVGDFLKAGL